MGCHTAPLQSLVSSPAPLPPPPPCRQSADEAPARVMVFAGSEEQARQLSDPLRTVLWGDHKISGAGAGKLRGGGRLLRLRQQGLHAHWPLLPPAHHCPPRSLCFRPSRATSPLQCCCRRGWSQSRPSTPSATTKPRCCWPRRPPRVGWTCRRSGAPPPCLAMAAPDPSLQPCLDRARGPRGPFSALSTSQSPCAHFAPLFWLPSAATYTTLSCPPARQSTCTGRDARGASAPQCRVRWHAASRRAALQPLQPLLRAWPAALGCMVGTPATWNCLGAQPPCPCVCHPPALQAW